MQQFTYLAEIFVWGGIASATIIAIDLWSCRQPMKIMNPVWILTGLWASFFGLIAYYWFGRSPQCGVEEQSDAMPQMHPHTPKMAMEEMKVPGMQMTEMEMGSDMEEMSMKMPPRPYWQRVTLSTLHCGGGCTLADLVGEWFLYFVPIAIGGSLIAGAWVIDYLLALGIGIGFQYAAIRGMEHHISRRKALQRAAKADILSLTSWQIGMYGWMAIVIFAINDGQTLPRTSYQFWFMMQIAMAFGFLCAVPINILLIRLGIKQGM